MNAHACGATSGVYTLWCITYGSNLPAGTCYNSESECNSNKPVGSYCGPFPYEYNAGSGSEISPNSCGVSQYFRKFAGCGEPSPQGGRKNCYNICDFGAVRNNVCVDEPGLSCGATNTSTPVASPTPSTPPQTPPPNHPSPVPSPHPSPHPSPQPGQCVEITRSVETPRIGDQVSFTCAAVNLANRYEFRYAYTTSNEVREDQYVALQPSSPSSLTSEPITVDKVGRYVAMCRPCFGNNQSANATCETWEVANLQEVVRHDTNSGQ